MSNAQYITNRKRADTMRAGYANIWHYTDRSAANGGPALSPHDDIGDGSKDSTGCLAATSASGLPTYVPPGIYLINSNITLTKNITLAPGATLKPASGVVVSLLGGYTTEDDNHVFDVSLGGSVIVGGSGYVTPMHFGADETGSIDSLATIQAMLDSGASNYDFGGGAFTVSSGLLVSLREKISIYGKATITQTGTLKKTLTLSQCSGADVSQLRFIGKGTENPWAGRNSDYNGVAAVCLDRCVDTTIEGIYATNHAGGSIFLDGACRNITISDNDLVGMGDGYIISEDNGSDAGIVSGGVGGTLKQNLLLSGNRISKHAFGILCQGSGTAAIVDNTITDIQGQHGIYYTNPGQLIVAKNTVARTAECGIKVQTQSLSDITESILIEGNNVDNPSHARGLGYPGITVAQVQSGKFLNVSVVGNAVANAYNENDIGTFTEVSENTITIVNHNRQDPNRISFSTTGTLPAGLSAAVLYYVKVIDKDKFQVALTDGGATVAITDNGTGTHTAFVTSLGRSSRGYGMLFQGCVNLKVAGNRMSNCGYVGLQTTTCSGTISGNSISNCQAAGLSLVADSSVGALYVDNTTCIDVATNKYSETSSGIWRAGIWLHAIPSGKIYLGNTILRPENELVSGNLQYGIYSSASVDVEITGSITNELPSGIPFYYLSSQPLKTKGTTHTDQYLVDCSAGGISQLIDLTRLPRNSILQDINVVVTEAFNGSGTKSYSIGVTGNLNRYIAAADCVTSTAAQTTMSAGTNNTKKFPDRIAANTQIVLNWTNNPGATQGKLLVSITYTVLAGK